MLGLGTLGEAVAKLLAAFGFATRGWSRNAKSIDGVQCFAGAEMLDAPVVFLGLSLPEHGYHAINENFDWQQAGGGIRMFIHYFSLLSQIKK